MKAFLHKIKKSNKFLLCLYILSLIIYITTYIFFTISILHLATIETPIRIVVLIIFGAFALIWMLSGLMSLFTKKYKSYVILLVFVTIFSALFSLASYYINTIYEGISSISKDTLVYTSALVTLKDSEFDSSKKIGMINDSNDVEGYILGNKLIKKYSITNEIERYDDYLVMLSDLLNNKIDAVVISNNYTITYSSEESLSDLAKLTKVVYTYSEEMDNIDNVSYTDKKLTEPFTVLLMGVDSENDGLNAATSFNGDTLMLITFNPNTLTASAFSVPRDTYVPIACRNNAYAKINSSAASGTNCVIKTIKNLTDIDVDFYVKVNFRGVVDLVNALGGITVDVQKPDFTVREGVDYHGQVCEQDSFRRFAEYMVCMDSGIQRLNGEQALAYSRSRKQFLGSDLDRVKHQQQVVTAIANELKNITSFEQFQNILSTVEKNMDTNMKSEQIMSLYNVIKKILLTSSSNGDVIQINKTYLETYPLPVWTGYSFTSALGYYQDSMEEISNMMKVNLNLQEQKAIKTYKIDYNDDYTSKYYGEGLRQIRVEKLMDELTGKTKEEALSYLESNGITPKVIYVDETSEYYSSSYSAGIVVYQEPHSNTIINNLSSATIYVNDKVEKKETKDDENTIVDNNTSDDEKTTQDEPKETLPEEITPIEDTTIEETNQDNNEISLNNNDEANE